MSQLTDHEVPMYSAGRVRGHRRQSVAQSREGRHDITGALLRLLDTCLRSASAAAMARWLDDSRSASLALQSAVTPPGPVEGAPLLSRATRRGSDASACGQAVSRQSRRRSDSLCRRAHLAAHLPDASPVVRTAVVTAVFLLGGALAHRARVRVRVMIRDGAGD